jgi:hypothetical protein
MLVVCSEALYSFATALFLACQFHDNSEVTTFVFCATGHDPKEGCEMLLRAVPLLLGRDAQSLFGEHSMLAVRVGHLGQNGQGELK